ncbi:MAG TPA: hypothetical protein VMY87_03095 [Armatimonadota bacterium]|nr:hypothetical protein [Armatimonadota bacterium]
MANTKPRKKARTMKAGDLASELPPDLRRIYKLYREAAKDPDFRARLEEILKPKVPAR